MSNGGRLYRSFYPCLTICCCFFPRDIFLHVTFALFENCHGHFFVSRAFFCVFWKMCHGQKKMSRAIFFKNVTGSVTRIFTNFQKMSRVVSRAFLPKPKKCHGYIQHVTCIIFAIILCPQIRKFRVNISPTHTHTHTHHHHHTTPHHTKKHHTTQHHTTPPQHTIHHTSHTTHYTHNIGLSHRSNKRKPN